MTVNIPYGDWGMADIQTDTYNGVVELFGGNTPLPVTQPYVMAAAADWPIGTVVGLNGGGLLVKANTSGPVKPIGVTAAATLATATDLHVPVFVQGCFNVDALTFHADYSTPTLKANAFGAATDQLVAIKLVKFAYAGIISNPTS